MTVEMLDDVLEIDLCDEHIATLFGPLAAAGQTMPTS